MLWWSDPLRLRQDHPMPGPLWLYATVCHCMPLSPLCQVEIWEFGKLCKISINFSFVECFFCWISGPKFSLLRHCAEIVSAPPWFCRECLRGTTWAALPGTRRFCVFSTGFLSICILYIINNYIIIYSIYICNMYTKCWRRNILSSAAHDVCVLNAF